MMRGNGRVDDAGKGRWHRGGQAMRVGAGHDGRNSVTDKNKPEPPSNTTAAVPP